MSIPFDAGRRRLLVTGVGLAASATLGPRAIGLILERLAASSDVGQSLRELIVHRESAALLGRAYLAATPGEADTSRLAWLILGAPGVPTGREAARVASRMRADFDAGRVVTVEGWIVSTTEARLCALCAIG
ncbi:MAG: hypothetical protein M3153_08430 [Chloroflexota bacterium]|nr:hypothetical protein [Chloroflexota bacterium]